MTQGGKRKGAGRKPGSIGKRTREIAERAIEGGITPLDYMLQILRDEAKDESVRLDAAKNAAPYIHPRLASIEASVNITNHEAALNDLE